MLENTLKYNFPENNSDPFDIDFNGNYFAFANAFSNLSNSLSDFSIDILGKNIPMGYKTIIILNRLIVLSNGMEIARWNKTIENINSSRFFMTTNKKIQFFRPDWNATIETNVIYKPDSNDASLYSSIWDDINVGLDFAKKISEENNCQVIISEVLESISWH